MATQGLYDRWSQRLRWSSLHGRVFIFSTGVVLLLLVALGILVNVLRRSEVILVAGSARNTDLLARSLARAYEDRPDHTQSLNGSILPMLDLIGPGGKPLDPDRALPYPAVEQGWLTGLMAPILRDQAAQGGFYRASSRTLEPSIVASLGPLDTVGQDSALETTTLTSLGDQAVRSNHLAKSRFKGNEDILVYAAYPVCDTRDCAHGVVGAAWALERLPHAASNQRKAMLWGSASFSLVALGVIALAWSVLVNVEESTAAVLHRLGNMETDLGPIKSSANPMLHMFEFQKMLDGLEHLGASLTERMTAERKLHGKLRHNERLASIGRLAAGVAHELRSPLATVRFRAQMAERAAQEAIVRVHCEIVLAEVDRLNGIIERLLAFSRPISLNKTAFDLAVLCEETTERWRLRFPQMRIDSNSLGASPLFCFADESRFRQAMDNVLENATHVLTEEHTPEPFIRLECERKNGCAVVCVMDNGGGFTKEALDQGMEPFFTTRNSGTGLGLAVTREIVEAHEGTLTINNRDGDGATVTLSLPLQPGFATLKM